MRNVMSNIIVFNSHCFKCHGLKEFRLRKPENNMVVKFNLIWGGGMFLMMCNCQTKDIFIFTDNYCILS